MSAPPRQAGPGSDRTSSPPVVPEAAGPAGPRLRIEEVGTRVGPELVEVTVTLALAGQRFASRAQAQGRDHDGWKLAAAATVGAIQQYLQQGLPVQPTPQVQLLETAITTTGSGQEVVSVTVRLAHGDRQTVLLGSALVRNDRCSTAVAAALDAVSRQLILLRADFSLAGARPDADAYQPLSSPSGDDRGLPAEPAVAPPSSEQPPSTPSRLPGKPWLETSSCPTRRRVSSALALAVHFTRSAVRAAVVDEAGHLLAEARRGCQPQFAPEAVLALTLGSCQEALCGLAPEAGSPTALGLAFSGDGGWKPDDLLAWEAGDRPGAGGGELCLRPELAALQGYLARSLSEELGLAVHPIKEAAAVAIAEARLGAAQTVNSLLFLEAGDEIEAVVVKEERLVELSQAGHMVVDTGGPRCACGQTGCWQALAGFEALVGRAIKAVTSGTPSALAAALSRGHSAVTPALICRLAMSGDAVAREAVEQTGRSLALGLGNLVALLDPEAVMISADPAAVRVALRHATELALKSSPRSAAFSRCVFLSPELGPTAPLLGAAAWAALHDPEGFPQSPPGALRSGRAAERRTAA